MYSSMHEIKRKNTGEFLNILTSDVQSVCSYYPQLIKNLFGNITAAVFASVALYFISWKMGLILFVSIPILILIINIISPLVQKANIDYKTCEDLIVSYLQERLRKIELIKSYFYQDKCIEKLSDMQNSKLKRFTKLGALEGLSAFSNNLMSALIFLICLGIGSYFVMKGDFTVGSLLVIVQLLNYITWPINNISATINLMNNSITSAERIFKIMNFSDEELSEMNKEININSLTIDGVWFSYDEKSVLKNFTYTFRKNKIVGVIGKSGQGKTTLLKLIVGIYMPNKGKIWATTNDNNTVDLAEIRNLISYVPSEEILFSDTISENICMSNERNDNRLTICSQKANILGFINQQVNSFDTIISEDGNTFSSGQVQRLGIARALYNENVQIIIFDEPTSNLDKESTKLFKDELRKLSHNKICIVVSHDNNIYDCFDETIYIKSED